MLQEEDMKKTKPIIMQGWGIRAIYDDIKTHTRRVVRLKYYLWPEKYRMVLEKVEETDENSR